MSTNFLEAVSHAALAGTGVYCLVEIQKQNFICPFVTYGIVTVNNLVAVLYWLSSYQPRLFEILRVTAYCQILFALPCITSQVWLNNGYPKETSLVWSVLPVCALLCHLIKEDLDGLVEDLIILATLVGLGYVCFVKEINVGTAAAISYAIAHCYIVHRPLYNYAMCVFCYLSLRTLGFGYDILK